MSPALETLTAEDIALFDQMKADDAAFVEPALPQDAEPAEPAVAAEPVVEKQATDKQVDKRALDEERTRRKAAEKTAADQRTAHAAELARANTRLEMLAAAADGHLKQNAAQPAAETPAPAFDNDPRAYIEHKFKTMETQLAEARQAAKVGEQIQQQMTRQQAEAKHVGELEAWATAQEREYSTGVADYRAAVEHLAAAREAQLRIIGAEDAGEIRQTIINEVRGLAARARQQGKNFGDVLYKLAAASGYRAGAAPAAAASASPAAVARVVPAVDPANAAERLIRGNDMATTIGSTGAASNGNGPAAQQIANMSDSEFAAFYAKVQKQGGTAMRSLFGS